MKKIVFTICSNNYLAHAATLMQTWFHYHPDTIGYIILVDKINKAVDYSIVSAANVIEIEQLNISSLNELVEKYNITELNTAVKPDAFLYLFEKHPSSKIIYLDPDIMITGAFDEVFDSLDVNDFVLTPHICKPIDDDKAPTDFHTLRGGVFNLGFIGLKDTEQINEFLYWWRDRVYKYGYCDLTNNMFYDQLWTNYIPTLYDKYSILKHPGYNMANWNLHERTLSKTEDGNWLVNEKVELKFFHFSGYKFTQPSEIGFYHTRYTFDTRPDLQSLFAEYQHNLIKNGAPALKMIPCVYFEKYKQIKLIRQSADEKAINAATPYKVKAARKLANIFRRIIYR
ncbi:glycosyltransferase family protein [Hymenobacter rubidus]|uniref:glycosyl transferase n=1 Tax=Hymenobacter rubidus TaxID=1441626 RepID=UPI00191CD68C|nr:glycosyl transferase [Hymenobacter rubidus]